MIYTVGQNLSLALGGAIGALAAHEAAGDDRTQFLAFLKANKIDPGLIMAGTFEEELKRAPLWPSSAGSGDATFEFKMGIVGLMIRHGLTARLSPYLVAEGKLMHRDGAVLWQRTDYIRDGEVRHTLEEYLQQPTVLRTALETAARKLSREFLRELHVQGGGRDPIAADDRAREDAEDRREEAQELEKDAAREAKKRQTETAQRQRRSS